jgi:site-specific recombinase XerC
LALPPSKPSASRLSPRPSQTRNLVSNVRIRIANEGTDTRLIQDFLGYASIANTVRYTKLAPGRLAAVRVR